MQKSSTSQQSRGFSLIEVMIAMAIGLLITLVITTTFLGQRKNYQENEAAARMQENARFAMELLVQDLRHAGFFGDIPEPVIIDTSAAPAGIDCLDGLFNFNSPSVMLRYGNAVTDATVDFDGCLTNGEIDTTAGSPILAMKRSATVPTDDADLETTKVYTYANGGNGAVFLPANAGVNPTGLSSGASWEYQPHVYFIDADDNLQRKSFINGALVTEPLAEGIEAFHIEFGIDQDNNGTPEYFYTPAADAATDSQLDKAVSATIYVLARTTEPDRDLDYEDTKTYNLGSVTIDPPAGDRFHRRVYTTTTDLRNIRSQVMLQEGP